jgi:hypothetical protein
VSDLCLCSALTRKRLSRSAKTLRSTGQSPSFTLPAKGLPSSTLAPNTLGRYSRAIFRQDQNWRGIVGPRRLKVKRSGSPEQLSCIRASRKSRCCRRIRSRRLTNGPQGRIGIILALRTPPVVALLQASCFTASPENRLSSFSGIPHGTEVEDPVSNLVFLNP